MSSKNELLRRLDAGEVVIGDGGMCIMMEHRGYLKTGPTTPEVSVEHPEALRQAHREFSRAGADVVQAFTFYGSEDKLANRGNPAAKYGCANINRASCKIAREVAAETDAIVVASVSQTPTYLSTRDAEAVKEVYRKQIRAFVDEKIEILFCEYFEYADEIKLAIEVGKEFGLTVGSTICMGPTGDLDGRSPAEVACVMVRAGADIIGLNCHYGPFEMLNTIKLMIDGVKAAGLKVHFMIQPVGYHMPDAGRQGFIDLPEFPFAFEPRTLTRWDAHKYARQAYEMGIRYIGGCCGFEPYHIRAISEELSPERGGKIAPASEKHELWGGGLAMHTKPWIIARARREYWENLQPSTGRPYSSALSICGNWKCVAGDELLQQNTTRASDEEIKKKIIDTRE